MRGGEREKEGERGGQIKGRERERERERISRFGRKTNNRTELEERR